VDKPTFKTVLERVVQGFEDPGFKARMASAKAAGDVPKMIALPMEIQSAAFAAVGLDAETGAAAFKAAGRSFGADADVAPLLARMKAALA
jgi:hypothetical protein